MIPMSVLDSIRSMSILSASMQTGSIINESPTMAIRTMSKWDKIIYDNNNWKQTPDMASLWASAMIATHTLASEPNDYPGIFDDLLDFKKQVLTEAILDETVRKEVSLIDCLIETGSDDGA